LNRAYRNRPLTEAQKFENQQRSKTRSTVERVFGLMKLHQGLGKARYMGLSRNKTGAILLAMSHNIKCGMNILKKYHKPQYSCAWNMANEGRNLRKVILKRQLWCFKWIIENFMKNQIFKNVFAVAFKKNG